MKENETLEEMVRRFTEENDFEGKTYLNFVGVVPEIRLEFLRDGWTVELRCEDQDCYFVGERAEEAYEKFAESYYDGETAIEAMQKIDAACKGFREMGCILTADIERE